MRTRSRRSVVLPPPGGEIMSAEDSVPPRVSARATSPATPTTCREMRMATDDRFLKPTTSPSRVSAVPPSPIR